MSTRMDRYSNEVEKRVNSRVNKNTSLYEDIKRSSFSRVSNNDNIRVIESNGKTIDINKIKKYILENKEEPRVRKVITVPEEKVEVNKVQEESKVYDINSVLEKARKSRELDYESERHKKISEQGYNALNKLKEFEKKEEESYEQEELNTEERTIVDLLNTVTIHKGEVNLLEELMSSDGTEEVTSPIKEEVKKSSIVKEVENKKSEEEEERTQELVNLKQKINDIDKSFYTNSMSFSKEDFEGFEELEKSVKKNSAFATVGIILLCIASLATLVIIANYIFELGLF